MYLCNSCSGEFTYLIFEYNTIVCENCSIRKNISNCSEFDGIQEAEDGEEEEDKECMDTEDTQQLFDTIDKIKNPRIRAYFKIVAHQYFGEGLV